MSQQRLDRFPALPVHEPLDEKTLQAAVIDLARVLGWRIAHFRSVPVKRGPRVVWQTPVQGDGAGFPDVVLVRERVVWAELKVGSNKLSEQQQHWISALRRAGQEVHVWTDRAWHLGEIDEALR